MLANNEVEIYIKRLKVMNLIKINFNSNSPLEYLSAIHRDFSPIDHYSESRALLR